MLDIKFVKENKELVKENIKKKFQDQKLPLVDEVVEIYDKVCALKLEGDNLRSEKNQASSQIGLLMREGKKDDAEELKKKVVEINERLTSLEKEEVELNTILRAKMMIIPNIIDIIAILTFNTSILFSNLFIFCYIYIIMYQNLFSMFSN